MTEPSRDRAHAHDEPSGIPLGVGVPRDVPDACCAPARDADATVPQGDRGGQAAAGSPSPTAAVAGLGAGLVSLEGGTFLMGTDDADAFPADLEGPVRPVDVAPFDIGACTVTNDEFARFVEDTGHRTDAETFGWSFVFHLLLHPSAQPHVRGRAAGAQWWLGVDGADWAHPFGPGSALDGLGDHPVVHVSHHDALAYCAWAGARLPQEAEWELAARGGLVQARYPWGDELEPDGEHRCNVWQGQFPVANTRADGWLGTAPVRTFAPNGFGLYQVAGNVWEHCADPWRDAEGRTVGDEAVIRGGSYLCHDSYCTRYRVAARSHTSRDSTTGNTGFRIAR